MYLRYRDSIVSLSENTLTLAHFFEKSIIKPVSSPPDLAIIVLVQEELAMARKRQSGEDVFRLVRQNELQLASA
ncbi:MAG: hypothetical protein AAF438_23790 [Pseudomonadota bacterium]